MNIKSLLLGSAAALVAVSGARAADAIVVAEPEPAEYVRICDVYGAGFYYIPGTETCLKVGGYLRYDIGVGALGHEDVLDKKDLSRGIIDTNDTYSKLMRAQVQLDARSETEYGTLRGYMALNFDRVTTRVGVIDEDDGLIGSTTSTGTNWNIDHALIQLGGLTIGYSDSLFESLTDSAGDGVANDSLVPYTPGKTHLIAYTFDGGNGFSATIGVEEGAGVDFALDSYVPHVVAGASFTQGWGKIAGVIGYDSVWGEVAGKLRVDVNVNEALTLWVMGGYQDWDWDRAVALSSDGWGPNLRGSYYGVWGGDWAVWGGAKYHVNEKLALNVQLSYDDARTFGAVVGANYFIVPGLEIRPEIAYTSYKEYDTAGDRIGKHDSWGGFLRFQRSF